jgi:hypothetical protein
MHLLGPVFLGCVAPSQLQISWVRISSASQALQLGLGVTRLLL